MSLLISNCTISTSRSVAGAAPVPVLTNVRANLRPRTLVYRPEGTLVQTEMLVDPGTPGAPTDLREGDYIQIRGEDNQPDYRTLRQFQASLVDRIGSPYGLGYLKVTCIGTIDV